MIASRIIAVNDIDMTRTKLSHRIHISILLFHDESLFVLGIYVEEIFRS
jgi:hypothetical protein